MIKHFNCVKIIALFKSNQGFLPFTNKVIEASAGSGFHDVTDENIFQDTEKDLLFH